MNRRDFARNLTLVAGAPLLFGCTQAQTAEWVAAEQALGQEFTVVAPELAQFGINASGPVTIPSFKIGNITVPPVTTTVQGVGSLASQLTAAVGAASTVAQGQTTLIKIETYTNALVPVIWPVLSPYVTAANPGVGLTLGLIVASLPALEGMLNFAVDFGGTLLSGDAQALAKLASPVAPVVTANRLGAALAPTSQDYLNELMRRAGMTR